MIPWHDVTSHRDEKGTRTSYRAGERGGVQIIGHPDGVLKVERSLPKALTGQNAVDLQQPDVPAALAAVDAELRALVPGVEWPAFGSLRPCRVDYCQSQRRESPEVVDLMLRRLQRLNLSRKGRPVVGESGSVSWPVGMFRPKAYNKGRETGDGQYADVLRLEVGVIGGRALGRIPGLVPHASVPVASDIGPNGPRDEPLPRPGVGPFGLGSEGSPELTVVDVLVPQAAGYVLGWFASRIGGYELAGEELSDLAFLREMVSFFGGRRASGLVGYCVVWQTMGARTWQEIEALELGDRSAFYRARADLRGFRDHLASLGQEPGDVDTLQARVAGLARLAA